MLLGNIQRQTITAWGVHLYKSSEQNCDQICKNFATNLLTVGKSCCSCFFANTFLEHPKTDYPCLGSAPLEVKWTKLWAEMQKASCKPVNRGKLMLFLLLCQCFTITVQHTQDFLCESFWKKWYLAYSGMPPESIPLLLQFCAFCLMQPVWIDTFAPCFHCKHLRAGDASRIVCWTIGIGGECVEDGVI